MPFKSVMSRLAALALFAASVTLGASQEALAQGASAPCILAKINPAQARYIAAAIVGEAAGEDETGQKLVGETIINRFCSGRFGGSIREVVLAPYQFSAFNVDAPHALELRQLAEGRAVADAGLNRSFERALKIAGQLLASEYVFLLPPDACHYFAPKLVSPPYWAASGDLVFRHGGHDFFGGVR
jgi:spore germination cell wall hydrolase CwlJ-like protein